MLSCVTTIHPSRKVGAYLDQKCSQIGIWNLASTLKLTDKNTRMGIYL